MATTNTKAQELALKGFDSFDDDDWNYLMTMDHIETKEFNTARSKDRGLLKHLKLQNESKENT
jgi:hypothetical protein